MAQQLSTLLTAATAANLAPLSEIHDGITETKADTLELSASAADTAVFFIKIPVNAKVHSVKLATDDLGTGCTMSVGLFKKDGLANTFTVVSANCFASAVDVATAAVP